MEKKKRILVLGASGMLGHAVFKYFHQKSNFIVYGTLRSKDKLKNYFTSEELTHLIPDIDADKHESFEKAFKLTKPDFVINAIGIIKHLPEAMDAFKSINVNSLLPHRLAALCVNTSSKLIHFSTDCVFNGGKGNYIESDNPDATDLYGRTKCLGELYYPNTVTIRTSIIGHELTSKLSLVDWFLGQNNKIYGYKNAIYTGLPTYAVAEIIEKYIIPNTSLKGLYHLSGEKISKFNLLKLIAEIYNKKIQIIEDFNFVIDRSLDSSKFKKETNFIPKKWPALIAEMKLKFDSYECYEPIKEYN